MLEMVEKIVLVFIVTEKLTTCWISFGTEIRNRCGGNSKVYVNHVMFHNKLSLSSKLVEAENYSNQHCPASELLYA